MASYLVSETQLVLVHWTVEADSEDEARERFMSDHETLTEISRDVTDSQGLTITPRRDNAPAAAPPPALDPNVKCRRCGLARLEHWTTKEHGKGHAIGICSGFAAPF